MWIEGRGIAEGEGAIAQLGERLLCKQRVVGSIPTGSTVAGGYAEGEGVGGKGD